MSQCPDCGARDLLGLGRLEQRDVFAGRRLEAPLDGGTLVQCCRCRLKFRDGALAPQASARLYDNDLDDSWATTLRSDQALVLDHLVQELRSGRVLDFGCYTGRFLATLPDRFERFGVEINARAAATARTRTGAQVWADISAVDAGDGFDAVVCIDVIEHLDSPRRLVQALLRLVRPGGVLIITTGDAEAPMWRWLGSRWWYCRFIEHVAFISESWLRHHQPGLGVDLARIARFNYRREGLIVRALRWIAFAAVGLRSAGATVLLRLRLASGANVRRWATMGLPGMGLTRDHLFIVLRKPVATSPTE